MSGSSPVVDPRPYDAPPLPYLWITRDKVYGAQLCTACGPKLNKRPFFRLAKMLFNFDLAEKTPRYTGKFARKLLKYLWFF